MIQEYCNKIVQCSVSSQVSDDEEDLDDEASQGGLAGLHLTFRVGGTQQAPQLDWARHVTKQPRFPLLSQLSQGGVDVA